MSSPPGQIGRVQVTTILKLADLNRRELENLLLTEHGLLRRILDVIREGTKPEWKVRRDIEQLLEDAYDKRPFRVALVRGMVTSRERDRAYRNEESWRGWTGG